jgi:molecular chaperone DnaK
MGLFVGIDLGTTRTAACVGTIAADGDLQWHWLPLVQPIDDGETTEASDILPSVVWIDGRHVLTGAYPERFGRRLTVEHPHSRLIRSVKREMGNLAWSIQFDRFTYRPFHIAGLLLSTVHRSLSRAYPGEPIERVTIATPASFSSAMRRETLKAAKLAGFPLDRTTLLDEPVAAFLSLFTEAPPADLPEPSTVLVFDMGGGTLDVSVIEYSLRERSLSLLSTSRYNEVAGDDLDLELAALLLKQIRAAGVPAFSADTVPGFGLGLLSMAEQTKYALGTLLADQGPRRGSFSDKIDYHAGLATAIEVQLNEQFPTLTPAAIRVPVADLMRAIKPFFDGDDKSEASRTIFVPIRQALALLNKTYDHVNKVYLTGGSSLFPPVQDAIRALFNQYDSLDPFHAVAQGALVWAANTSTRSFHLRERLFDNLYLQRVGNKFLEVLSAPIPVPARGEALAWANVELPKGSDAVHLPGNQRRVRLDFFRGVSAHDPSMTVAHSEMLRVPAGVLDGAGLTKLEAAVDADKIYHCRFYFEDHGKEVQSEVDFWPLEDQRVSSAGSYGEGLILNGEPLGSPR